MSFTLSRRLIALAACAACVAGASAQTGDIKERNIKLSYVTSKDSPYGLGVTKLAEIVAARSGGKMKLRGYSDGQLGAEVQSISAAQGGVLEMALVSTAAVAGNVKEFALFDFPFLFGDEREAYAVLDGAVGTQLLGKLPDRGLVGLCYWEVGFRHVTNSRRPVNRLEDFKGLKIRTIQNPVFVDVFNTLGANATPMAFTEVYTALESKALDGQETPYNIIYTSRSTRCRSSSAPRVTSTGRASCSWGASSGTSSAPTSARSCRTAAPRRASSSARPAETWTRACSPRCVPRAWWSTRSRPRSAHACASRSSP